MAVIVTGFGRDGFGDKTPLIDTVLRDIADDLASLKPAAPAALTAAVVATANATDLTTSEALANSLKTQFNLLVADVIALRGLLVTTGGATIKTTKG